MKIYASDQIKPVSIELKVYNIFSLKKLNAPAFKWSNTHVRYFVNFFPTDHEVQIRSTQTFMFELEQHVSENVSLIGPYLTLINAHLHNAVLACRAALSSTECQPFPQERKNLIWEKDSTSMVGVVTVINKLPYIIKSFYSYLGRGS